MSNLHLHHTIWIAKRKTKFVLRVVKVIAWAVVHHKTKELVHNYHLI